MPDSRSKDYLGPRVRGCFVALLACGVGLGIGGCVDAPITPDQLEADGQLRMPPLEQQAFSAQQRPQPQQAAQISAALAAQPSGPIEDATRFAADVGAVHLHLRADGLGDARSVVFRWSHAGLSALVPGELKAGDTLALASTFPIAPDQVGTWQVEVLGEAGHDGEPTLLFQRTFEVYSPPK